MMTTSNMFRTAIGIVVCPKEAFITSPCRKNVDVIWKKKGKKGQMKHLLTDFKMTLFNTVAI